MTEGSVITKEVASWIGKELGPVVYEIEKSTIRKVVEAVGDDNPLWSDDDYAKKNKYGGIVAPPILPVAFAAHAGIYEELLAANCSLKNILNGSNEIEPVIPIRPGDVITVTGKVIDIYEKEGKMGKMLFTLTELVYTNQENEVVAKRRDTLIRY